VPGEKRLASYAELDWVSGSGRSLEQRGDSSACKEEYGVGVELRARLVSSS